MLYLPSHAVFSVYYVVYEVNCHSLLYNGKFLRQPQIHTCMEKIDKAQVSGVPIDVIFDKKYMTGGYRFIIGRF